MIGSTVEQALSNLLKEYIVVIQDKAVELYEDMLFGIVDVEGSLAYPENFIDLFITRIEEFEYINEDDDFILEIPNNETFDFSGELIILQLIFEGILDDFVELPEVDALYLINESTLSIEEISAIEMLPGNTDEDGNIDIQFRLIESSSSIIEVIENILGKKLVEFPFSNSEPILLFEELEDFVKDDLQKKISAEIKRVSENINRKV